MKPLNKKRLRKFIYYILTVFLLSSLSAIYLVQRTGVIGNSMEPGFKNGQSVLLNKIAYRKKDPERFDVIVFRYLYKDDEYYLKRVIGLPGETVQIINGSVYIDGLKLEDPYGQETIQNAERAEGPVLLSQDEYFVLGDNRNYSFDSRESSVGNVKRVQILGRVFAKFWPFEWNRHK